MVVRVVLELLEAIRFRGEINEVLPFLGENSLTNVLVGHTEGEIRREKIESGTEILNEEKWLSFLLIFQHFIISLETFSDRSVLERKVFI